ncbi:MAG: serpin family protein [Gemmatimonadales bacterium]|nr:serpin family protein [Gemmatimonadales bacterium]NIN11765.1 serpin family protein [Gemmatimonadales bacterium]NIN50321.1 serpin family protein [Gemmatimonadales bacterium]NIP07785.1 serpin family protein [Gemmatimonadales bacterium]NIQ99217.1 serpin family protein [Gemmatimonadales bacterium]
MTPFGPRDAENTGPTVQVAQGNNRFALELYSRLRAGQGNLFFSPYSVSTALAMSYGGARGDTAAQMARTLHFPPDQERLHAAVASLEATLSGVEKKGEVQLTVANALWPQEGHDLLESFLALTKAYYGVLVTSVDYRDPQAAARTINGWVERATQDQITNLVAPDVLSSLTRLVLTNAIYFKGSWASQFDKDHTTDVAFWVAAKQRVTARMMAQSDEFRYAAHDRLQVLELPYAGEDLSMTVLLPRARDGLAELEEGLTLENLERWTRDLSATEVDVFLPRFTITSAFQLNDALLSMGMADAFDIGKADFSGMDGRKNWFYIGAVLHKAFTAVDEEGTEAAAATAVVMVMGLPEEAPPTFRADHPFLFLIRECSTGSILFLGRVVDPTSDAA